MIGSDSTALPLGVGCVIGLLIGGVIVRALSRGMFARFPHSVIKRLNRPGGRYDVSVGAIAGAWNPANPFGTFGTGNYVPGPGTAIYTLDDAGVIHLDFQPRSGPPKHLSGPIPDTFLPKTPSKRRLHRMVWGVVMSYVTFIVIGFSIGYLLVRGSASTRISFGLLGALAAVIVVHVVVLVLFQISRSARGE